MALNFLSRLTGSFAMPAAENPTVAMVEAAYRHHRLDIRYINCEVPPEKLADAVKGAGAMGWIGFNCSIPHKVAVIEHLYGLGDSGDGDRRGQLRGSPWREIRWRKYRRQGIPAVPPGGRRSCGRRCPIRRALGLFATLKLAVAVCLTNSA